MGFKLVRQDKGEPLKIQLPVGKHIIGRGRFPYNDDDYYDDIRVARNHAELTVTADTIVLKAIHQNPCYLDTGPVRKGEALYQDSTRELSHGDKFGLTPDSFWYEVIYYADQYETECEEQSTQGSAANVPTSQSTSTSNKRPIESHISNAVVSKKGRSNATLQPYPEVPAPRLISNQAAPEIARPPPPRAAVREKCLYGANCCRRNPEHRQQYSHPSDSDWELPPHLAAERLGVQVFRRRGFVFYIQAQSVNFFDNHIEIEDDGETVDYDY